MTEIFETEIKSMTKEQNYMRGYKNGESDVLDKIRAEIIDKYMTATGEVNTVAKGCLQIIDKYRAESEDEEC